jgi:arginine/lysine/ornithine decarboxylase
MANLTSMFAAQNATSTSALIVIFTSTRACTIALVVRANAASLHRDLVIVCIIQVVP